MEYTILILLLPLASFLVLGLAGMKMRPAAAGAVGTAVLAVVALLSYWTAFEYFSAGRDAAGVFPTLIPWNAVWLPIGGALHIDLGILLDPISVMMLPSDAFWLFPDVICPDISVCICILLSFHGFLEPLMCYRCMPRHQIKNDMHSFGMRFSEQVCQIFIRTIPGRYCIIVLHIISSISKRRLEAWINPYCVTA